MLGVAVPSKEERSSDLFTFSSSAGTTRPPRSSGSSRASLQGSSAQRCGRTLESLRWGASEPEHLVPLQRRVDPVHPHTYQESPPSRRQAGSDTSPPHFFPPADKEPGLHLLLIEYLSRHLLLKRNDLGAPRQQGNKRCRRRGFFVSYATRVRAAFRHRGSAPFERPAGRCIDDLSCAGQRWQRRAGRPSQPALASAAARGRGAAEAGVVCGGDSIHVCTVCIFCMKKGACFRAVEQRSSCTAALAIGALGRSGREGPQTRRRRNWARESGEEKSGLDSGLALSPLSSSHSSLTHSSLCLKCSKSRNQAINKRTIRYTLLPCSLFSCSLAVPRVRSTG